MNQPQDSKNSANSGGGAQIDGDVHTKTFVGRDQYIYLGPLKISKYLLWAILAVILLIIIIAIRNTFLLGDIRDVDIATPTVTPTATSTATSTPTLTPTATPTDTPLPTPTPLPVQPATEDETLILITNFYLAEGIDDSETHRQIAQAIEGQIQANSLENVRVGIEPNVILREDEQEHARRIAEQFNASIIIWGDETSVKFTVNFLNLRQPTFKAADVTINADHTSVHKAALANPSPYIRFVTEGLPAQLSFLSLFAMGQTEYNRGYYKRATSIIELAVQPVKNKRIEGLRAAYFRLGWLYQIPLEQPERAIAYYDQAITLDSDYAAAYRNRGIAYSDLGEYDQAIADYDQAISLDSDYAAAYNSKCWLHGLWQEPEKALPYCEEAISKASEADKPTFRDSRGLVYALLGETEKAIADFQFYVEAFAKNPIKALSIAKRKIWIESLQAGENPFTPEVLEELRQE